MTNEAYAIRMRILEIDSQVLEKKINAVLRGPC